VNHKLTWLCLLILPVALHAQLREFSIEELLQRAENGDAESQFRLATRYDSGRDVPRNGAEAKKWYTRAAESGYAEAQNSLGSALQAEKQYAEARRWFERAAEQSNPLALNNLAYLYDLGLGIDQDRKKAFDLYLRSANFGWAEAMWNLANIYGAGQLGKVDLVDACIWTLRARRFMGADVQLAAASERTLPHLKHSLSAEEFASCEHESENWHPQAIK
jgi:TPR repeat protein